MSQDETNSSIRCPNSEPMWNWTEWTNLCDVQLLWWIWQLFATWPPLIADWFRIHSASIAGQNPHVVSVVGTTDGGFRDGSCCCWDKTIGICCVFLLFSRIKFSQKVKTYQTCKKKKKNPLTDDDELSWSHDDIVDFGCVQVTVASSQFRDCQLSTRNVQGAALFKHTWTVLTFQNKTY